MNEPDERGTPAQGNIQSDVIEKLREREGFYKQRHQLAQKGSVQEAFWDGCADGMAVAILIVEGEQ